MKGGLFFFFFLAAECITCFSLSGSNLKTLIFKEKGCFLKTWKVKWGYTLNYKDLKVNPTDCD